MLVRRFVTATFLVGLLSATAAEALPNWPPPRIVEYGVARDDEGFVITGPGSYVDCCYGMPPGVVDVDEFKVVAAIRLDERLDPSAISGALYSPLGEPLHVGGRPVSLNFTCTVGGSGYGGDRGECAVQPEHGTGAREQWVVFETSALPTPKGTGCSFFVIQFSHVGRDGRSEPIAGDVWVSDTLSLEDGIDVVSGLGKKFGR